MSELIQTLLNNSRIDKYFIIIDRRGQPLQTSADRQAMLDICNSEDGLKAKLRMLECQVTKINVFGAFSGETHF